MINISSLIRMIANEIVIAYKADKDPVVIKLNKAIEFLKNGKFEAASHILNSPDMKKSMDSRKDHWKQIHDVREAVQAYENARKMAETKNPHTLQAVLKSVQYLKNSEAAINRLQLKPPEN